MAINRYNVKKWAAMLRGKSIFHVRQDMGKSFVPGRIEGYFNNLTEKVTRDPDTLAAETVPVTHDETGDILFPVAIFQYGLGAYDLYLQTGEDIYLRQFRRCADWALERQEPSGAWDNFSHVYPENPRGAMCQGEGASLLVRAYVQSGEQRYLDAAENAIRFMLTPVQDGGTTRYDGADVVLLEYTNLPPVLNGWVFALFGLYDLNLVRPTPALAEALERTTDTLARHLPLYDLGYWSKYDDGQIIASPFYHDLHIAQLEALDRTFDRPEFAAYRTRYENYRSKPLGRARAFAKKAMQKIRE